MAIFILLCIVTTNLLAQIYSGIIVDDKDRQPIAYANIGIPGKNVGTVSNENGFFSIEAKELSDTLKISFIGYDSSINTFKNLQTVDTIYLIKSIIGLEEVVIKPQNLKTKTFGVNAKSSAISAGFFNNSMLGSEIGVLMKNKHKAYLKKLHLNFTSTFDTLFCRINVYKQTAKGQFENILNESIYYEIPTKEITQPHTIDLVPFNIGVEGKFLVSLEFIKDLGEGNFLFNAALFNKTYAREASQSKWETIPIGVSISVEALIEK